jgi:hypothetical protein
VLRSAYIGVIILAISTAFFFPVPEVCVPDHLSGVSKPSGGAAKGSEFASARVDRIGFRFWTLLNLRAKFLDLHHFRCIKSEQRANKRALLQHKWCRPEKMQLIIWGKTGQITG